MQMAEASPGLRVRPVRGRNLQIDLALAALPTTTLFSIDSLNLHASRPPIDDMSITIPLQGGFSTRVGTGTRRHSFGLDEIYLLNPERDFDLRARDTNEVLVAGAPAAELRQKARALAGSRTEEPPEVIAAASPTAGALVRFTHYLWSELQRPGGLWDCPVALAEMEDCLVSLLALAQNPPVTEATNGGFVARLAAMRRAEDFLMQHLMKPVTRSDLAAAAGVSIRTVSRGFRERHGISPLAWLKERRLEAAQRDLRAAHPEEVTVTEVALRYGFENLGRFSVDYRRRFGETPSQTLRS